MCLFELILEKQGWKIVSIPYWISPDRSVTRLRAHVRETLGEKLKVFLPLPSLDAFEEGKKLYLTWLHVQGSILLLQTRVTNIKEAPWQTMDPGISALPD